MSENKHIEFVINDVKYALLPMGPMKAFPFSAKVGIEITKSLVGDSQPLFDVIESMASLGSKLNSPKKGKGSGEITEKDGKAVFDAMSSLIGRIDPDRLHELGKEALSHEVYAGNKKLSDPLNFEQHFTAHPGDLFPVAIWAIREHSKKYLAVSDGCLMKAIMG